MLKTKQNKRDISWSCRMSEMENKCSSLKPTLPDYTHHVTGICHIGAILGEGRAQIRMQQLNKDKRESLVIYVE